MKIIDKTPLLDQNGQLSLVSRIQGTLQYGLNWSAELEAQKNVIAQLDRVLEKGFVLIRNFTLPNSEIVIPIILLGPNGATVIHVTTAKGFFEAKGDQWNTVVNGRGQPARSNLLRIASGYARVVQKYLEYQKIELSAPVEPVLITADPGAHVDSMRPTARVVMSDAIKQFATTLLQARPVWRSDIVFTLADRIVDPQPAQEEPPLVLQQPAVQPASSGASRAQAIFTASDQAKPLDINDLGFAFEENSQEGLQFAEEPSGSQGSTQSTQKGKILGMSSAQVIVLAVLLLCECAIVIGFGALFLTNQ
jgi:hypothetical protein